MKPLALRQLDRRFDLLRRDLPLLHPPRRGWLHLLRTTLGMRQRDLGTRLGITAQAVGQLEKREVDESVSLRALRQAADALGADLHYVIVPREPIDAQLEERLDRVARLLAGAVEHSMRMEDQAVGDEEMRERIESVKERLRRSPSSLWHIGD